MVSSYLVRVEFACREPFMYPFKGVYLSQASKSASSFMDIVDDKKPLKAEIWDTNFFECVAVVDHIHKEVEG